VQAQEQPGAGAVSVQDREVTGVIQAVDDSSVTIDGTVYQITDQTQNEGLLQVGDTATLEYSVNDDGTFNVLEISAESEVANENVDDQGILEVETDNGQDEDLTEDDSEDETLQQSSSGSQQSAGDDEQEGDSTSGDD
jgi:hypothetical protein